MADEADWAVRRWIARPMAAITVLASLLLCCVAEATTTHVRTIVALYPENADGAPGNALVLAGMRATFAAGSSDQIRIRNEYLDLARFEKPDQRRILVDFLRHKYAGQKIDVVMTGLSSALDFVLQHRNQIFPGVPVVFIAVDRDELAKRALPADVIGVPITMDLVGTLDIALRLQPTTRRVFVIAGASPFDTYWEGVARRAFRSYENRVQFEYLSGLSLDELLKRVSHLPDHSVIQYLHVYEDGAGTTFIPAQVLERVAAAANAPVYGHVSSYIDHGIVGGRVLSFELEGRHAAQLALGILAGQRPQQITHPAVSENVSMFDWRQLRRWGIGEANLPPDSDVRFREPSLWSLYQWYIVGAISIFVVQTALIATLLVQRRRRREAQAALRNAEAVAGRQINQIAHLDRVAAMGHLASSIAHELNQPLAGILANAQAARLLLSHPQLDVENLRECLGDIISDDKRASEVIRRMRLLLKKTDFVSGPIDLNDLTANTIRLVTNDALLHGVMIEFIPAPKRPVGIGDTIQIQQVILNLLTNAITAAANGDAVPATVTVWTSAAVTPYVELGVHDSGNGIVESDLDQIFEPFFTTKPQGLGMGLTISRTIVEAHGGRLLVDNGATGGATFRVHLRAQPRATR
jgi:signal transduction histidine kinase